MVIRTACDAARKGTRLLSLKSAPSLSLSLQVGHGPRGTAPARAICESSVSISRKREVRIERAGACFQKWWGPGHHPRKRCEGLFGCTSASTEPRRRCNSTPQYQQEVAIRLLQERDDGESGPGCSLTPGWEREEWRVPPHHLAPRSALLTRH
jgi:hypothetical protein